MHHSTELLNGDSSIVVLVKKRKGFFQFSNLLLAQLVLSSRTIDGGRRLRLPSQRSPTDPILMQLKTTIKWTIKMYYTKVTAMARVTQHYVFTFKYFDRHRKNNFHGEVRH